MATAMVKSTYSLDVETVGILEEVARRWEVSKSEALRRAIRSIGRELDLQRTDAVQALDELQDSLRLTPSTARAWVRRCEDERTVSSVRREPNVP